MSIKPVFYDYFILFYWDDSFIFDDGQKYVIYISNSVCI